MVTIDDLIFVTFVGVDAVVTELIQRPTKVQICRMMQVASNEAFILALAFAERVVVTSYYLADSVSHALAIRICLPMQIRHEQHANLMFGGCSVELL